jgi:hypothetical protein
MFKLVDLWRNAWSDGPPVLQWFKRGDTVIVQDSRFGPKLRELVLDVPAARVLQACDEIRSLDSLSDLAERACINELLDAGLLVQDGKQVLSIVVPAAKKNY